jgi:hypothetical protein
MEKLAFVFYQYALLGVFAAAAYGLGRPLTGWITKLSGLSAFITVPLELASGTGIAMIALFVAGVFGYLSTTFVWTVILIGLGLAITPIAMCIARAGRRGPPVKDLGRITRIPWSTWWWAVLIGAASLHLLLKPLQPPHAWDELMYHLPYARFWAEQGALTVNEWLRYPLSAYNMDLLYAASLLFDNDVLPHLLHAFTAVSTAVLTFGIGRRYMDWPVGLIAVVELLVATRWGWENAYVDLGVMLFWSCAFAALALRYEHGDRRFSYLAAFFAGIAVGIKYQALFYLPLFVLLALVVERRRGVIAKSALILAGTGGFWYLRNFLISGDPLHPLGGPLFGYWLWNAQDLTRQYADLSKARDWPEWFLVPAIGAAWFWPRSTPIERGLMLSAAAAVGIWYLVSGYPRYLVAIYPMLALLSAFFLVGLFQRSGAMDRVSSAFRKLDLRWHPILALLLLVTVAGSTFGDVAKDWGRVAANAQDRADYLSKRFAGYDLLRSTGEEADGTLYQLGFEGELYYLGNAVRGDWLGPGRYREVTTRRGSAVALAQYLTGLGVDKLLLNLGRSPFSELSWDPAFLDHFELIARSDKAALYRLGSRDAGVRGGGLTGPRQGAAITTPSAIGGDPSL